MFGLFPFAGAPFADVGVVKIPANVNVTGVQATGAVGAVAVKGKANVFVTGVEAAGQLGTAAVSGDINTSVTGVQGTGQTGAVTAVAPLGGLTHRHTGEDFQGSGPHPLPCDAQSYRRL